MGKYDFHDFKQYLGMFFNLLFPTTALFSYVTVPNLDTFFRSISFTPADIVRRLAPDNL